MSAITSPDTHPPSALQRPAPIADPFALRQKKPALCLAPHRIIWPIHSASRYLTDTPPRLIPLIATSGSSVILQIPIAL